MAVSRSLIAKLRKHLQEDADPDIALKMATYAKSAMPQYGVRSPTLKEICKTVYEEHRLNSFVDWQDTILAIWRRPKHREMYFCAINLLNSKSYRNFHTLDTIPMLEEMIVTGAWWDLVDGIAPYRLRDLLEKHPTRIKALLKKWAKSPDVWLRRAAILAQLRRKQDIDTKLLYSCIEPSIDSQEFFLRKAVGWALRDLAWTNPSEVDRYIKSNQDRLSPLSIREAIKNRKT